MLLCRRKKNYLCVLYQYGGPSNGIILINNQYVFARVFQERETSKELVHRDTMFCVGFQKVLQWLDQLPLMEYTFDCSIKVCRH